MEEIVAECIDNMSAKSWKILLILYGLKFSKQKKAIEVSKTVHFHEAFQLSLNR